ncbi:helix-hairpin-helix domain-containing protein [Enterococcus alcedinis]|uniref:Helix-hairpin-helix DNA-binding motif class 1 domain-containing protein n=1 Tax=Enterococcus alcedinis TaxID=1274384 RepID=A0A917N3G9_9ENTE|nr:helix-hairpin-helix domain-containing protein [Enterococcus alcedinis]MBP2101016.1 competence protein ComEA [Enterococcus alcedinis]GGI64685.1 hypothetical protein GCM10011482_03390 [Enterococcus alcedinis]
MKIDKKQRLVIVGGSVIVLIIVLFLMLNDSSKEEELWETVESSSESLLEVSTITSTSNNIAVTILVDIKGEIKKPGVYEVSSDSRLNELILLAGGFTEKAEERQLNLAEKLSDQQMIYVPSQDEVEFSFEKVHKNEDKQSSLTEDLININTADLSQLQQLAGVGPSKAQAIISYREENGPFGTIEDLLQVSGFGEKTFEKLKLMIKI